MAASGRQSAASSVSATLSALTPLKQELDELHALVSTFRDEHYLPPRLAELPNKLRSATTRCRTLHREFVDAW